jgi:hypothetical protein
MVMARAIELKVPLTVDHHEIMGGWVGQLWS